MIIDVEIFRRCACLSNGINTSPDQWLETGIAETGPGGNFLKHRSTLKAVREGTWYFSKLGFHDTYEKWKAAGMPDAMDNIKEVIQGMLKDYQPLPLDPTAERELEHLERKARKSER